MAEAPGHRLGQIIGDALEDAIRPLLADFAGRHGLYLDFKGPRPARDALKCTWVDDLGNAHDLDFVLERGGSPGELGLPAAFIETAWRRYTKHSRAKAQEIQGAVLPLLAKHAHLKPFAGAVVAGAWTPGALAQLRSSGFAVLHVDYPEIVAVFARFGIDVAADEGTPDAYLAEQVATHDALGPAERAALARALAETAPERFARFSRSLEEAVTRTVTRVEVLPLYGAPDEHTALEGALLALGGFRASGSDRLQRIEVRLEFSNGDEVEAAFPDTEAAAEFLATFL